MHIKQIGSQVLTLDSYVLTTTKITIKQRLGNGGIRWWNNGINENILEWHECDKHSHGYWKNLILKWLLLQYVQMGRILGQYSPTFTDPVWGFSTNRVDSWELAFCLSCSSPPAGDSPRDHSGSEKEDMDHFRVSFSSGWLTCVCCSPPSWFLLLLKNLNQKDNIPLPHQPLIGRGRSPSLQY